MDGWKQTKKFDFINYVERFYDIGIYNLTALSNSNYKLFN